MTREGRKKLRISFSSGVVISVIAVVAVVATALSFTHFQRQKEQAIELLLQKGATLIRSFEAGLRGPASEDKAYLLQKLLIEMAQQPGIDYIIITDAQGNIIADSDPSLVGEQYGLDLELAKTAAARDIKWRQAANPQGADTFEVYRGFFPFQRSPETKAASAHGEKERHNKLIIYAGLNMAAIDKAVAEDTRNTIVIAVILFLIGSSVIVLLFLGQAYRLARSSLSRVTAFSEVLVTNMPIGLIALDESAHITTCNEKAGSLLDIDCSAVLGKKAEAILPVPLQKVFMELSEHSGLWEKDWQYVAASGENKILEIVAAGLAAGGSSTGRIMLLRDVTTMRQLEGEVAKSRHLNSIGSLAAGVAHEIRNPLSSIKGYAVYFKERFGDNPEDQKTANIMIQEVERLNRVISQLIEFARPLELKPEKVQLPALIDHILTIIAAEARKNQIEIVVDAALDLPLLNADPDKVKQVLLNILLNALAAMKTSGKIVIRLTHDQGKITVSIADTGVGIDKVDLPRIYDPYFTSKPAGTGLGLAVAQKIMEAHGGRITLESNIGEGTTVFLEFPLVNARTRQDL